MKKLVFVLLTIFVFVGNVFSVSRVTLDFDMLLDQLSDEIYNNYSEYQKGYKYFALDIFMRKLIDIDILSYNDFIVISKLEQDEQIKQMEKIKNNFVNNCSGKNDLDCALIKQAEKEYQIVMDYLNPTMWEQYNLELQKAKQNRIENEESITYNNTKEITGGRSNSNIMRVVRQNMASLQYEYSKYFRDNSEKQEHLTIKFAIDEFGKVISVMLLESTINDNTFEQILLEKIKRWSFGEIEIQGDITEIEYPFIFTTN